jgi:hypothetical protein
MRILGALLLALPLMGAEPISPTPKLMTVEARMALLETTITTISGLQALKAHQIAAETITPTPEPKYDFEPHQVTEEKTVEVSISTSWCTSAGEPILAIGTGAFEVSHWGPTPIPSPTPTPEPKWKNIDKPVNREWEIDQKFGHWEMGAYNGPDTYERPKTPEEVPVDLYTSDSKHWRAKWIEVKE